MNVDPAVLHARLDTIAARASERIGAMRGRRAASSAAERAVVAFLVVGGILFAGQLALVVAGRSPRSIGLALLLIPLAALYVLVQGARARRSPTARSEALAAMDHAVRSGERLQTADEFMGIADRSPFMEAAVDDAQDAIQNALRAEPLGFVPLWRPAGRSGASLAAGLLLLVAAVGLGIWGPAGITASEDDTVADASDAGPTASETRDEVEAEPPVLPDLAVPDAPRRTPAAGGEHGAERRDASSDESEDAKRSEGKTGEGRSADAQAASGRTESRGAPSNQAQTSTPKEPMKKEAVKPPKPKKKRAEAEQRKRKSEENSGATAGRGSSRGSSKNPAASAWSSKDQVPAQEESELEDDEDAEDEDEDQESRGGVQPALRDRKPPVSRDLNIGFGNQKNPDANQRGGPSQPKKSRGTASLVLGVPVPDRVKGQPNPGRNKITQERIEPRPEESVTVDASARAPREGPVGRVGRPEMESWMRDLVRAYFLSLRGKDS
ncbi:MAG: hypothetical protein GY711_08280 [bacterium]|nr:hypothetical protein [bacterium]